MVPSACSLQLCSLPSLVCAVHSQQSRTCCPGTCRAARATKHVTTLSVITVWKQNPVKSRSNGRILTLHTVQRSLTHTPTEWHCHPISSQGGLVKKLPLLYEASSLNKSLQHQDSLQQDLKTQLLSPRPQCSKIYLGFQCGFYSLHNICKVTFPFPSITGDLPAVCHCPICHNIVHKICYLKTCSGKKDSLRGPCFLGQTTHGQCLDPLL